MTPTRKRGWGNSVVVGIGHAATTTPTSSGRVRVKYPALGDDAEGWWARDRRARRRQGARAADDAVGRRRGRWSASSTATPPARTCSARSGTARTSRATSSQTDGSFALQSDQKIAMHAEGRRSRSSATRTSTLETQERAEDRRRTKPTGDVTIEGSQGGHDQGAARRSRSRARPSSRSSAAREDHARRRRRRSQISGIADQLG